jgi:magnesium transporter
MPAKKKQIVIPANATSFTKDYYGLKVIDKDGERIGSIVDMAITMGEEFPKVSSIVVSVKVKLSLLGSAKFEAIVPWRTVKYCDDRELKLGVGYSELKPGKIKNDELQFKKHIMDQQIVDNEGRKLLRVNDVKLKAMDGNLRLVGVEVGIKGLLYRLGAGRRLERLADKFNVKVMENIIMWDLVSQFDREMNRIKLVISQEMLKDLINL